MSDTPCRSTLPCSFPERTTGHRNRAVANLMLNFGMVSDVVDQSLELYFQQCSVLVNALDLAMMGATLAQRRAESGERRASAVGGVRQGHPVHDVHLRHVRLRR